MRSSRPWLVLLALPSFLWVAAGSARACPVHDTADPTLSVAGGERPRGGRVRLMLDERFAGFDEIEDGTLSRGWSLRSSLYASWAPIDRLTFAALLPMVSLWLQPSPDEAVRAATGLGDLELSVRGVVYRDRIEAPHHVLSLLGGVKAPTGPLLRDGTGEAVPDDDQPGTGSWDPFAGLAYTWFRAPWSIFTSAEYRYTTTGREGYRRGTVFAASVGAQYQPHPRVSVGLSADLGWSAPDTLAGQTIEDTGGVLLAVTPSLLVSVWQSGRRGIYLRAAGQIPVAYLLSGTRRVTPAGMLSAVFDLN